MAFDYLHCPICDTSGPPTDSQLFTPLTTTEPPAYRCTTCGLGFESQLSTHPAGDYTEEAYDQSRNAGEGGPRWTRFHHDSAVAAMRLSQLAPLLPAQPGSWIDVGCSNGATLALLQRRGWSVMGVEADHVAVEQITKVLGIPVLTFPMWLQTAASKKSKTNTVTVVSFFDVVEHLLDPVGTLRAAARSLAPDGLLVLEVPDLESTPPDFTTWRHRRLGKSLQGWTTEHIWHFTAGALDSLRIRHLAGMAAVRTTTPVSGRLQVVWRKVNTAPMTEMNSATEQAALSTLAIDLLRLPEADRRAKLAELKNRSEEGFRVVTDEIRRLRDLTHNVKG